jgi:hypothetical protein
MLLLLPGHKAMNEIALKLVTVLQSNSKDPLSYCLWLPNIQYICSCHIFNFILCFLWENGQNAWLSCMYIALAWRTQHIWTSSCNLLSYLTPQWHIKYSDTDCIKTFYLYTVNFPNIGYRLYAVELSHIE